MITEWRDVKGDLLNIGDTIIVALGSGRNSPEIRKGEIIDFTPHKIRIKTQHEYYPRIGCRWTGPIDYNAPKQFSDPVVRLMSNTNGIYKI